MKASFQRAVVGQVLGALERGPRRMHLITGPRQVGKTTAALQVIERWSGPTRYAAADQFLPPGPDWLLGAWELARLDARRAGRALLVLDEVQKVRGWSEGVKAAWDEDRREDLPLDVILLGSSALLLGPGATESLAGRFWLHRCLHWTFPECAGAFGWDLDTWIWRGGYPGTAPFDDDQERRAYVRDALVEAVLARDVLAMETVTRPALLRQLFALAARYPAEALSYNKMLGQLQDAGNTTTLAHYLELLERAFLVSGLEPYAAGAVRRRGGSPKLVLWNNALVTAFEARSFEICRQDHALWGRLVENAVGAHLLNHLHGRGLELGWWRERDQEVDFVVSGGRAPWALEVKSVGRAGSTGLGAFLARHPSARPLLIGGGGMPLDEFFSHDPAELLP